LIASEKHYALFSPSKTNKLVIGNIFQDLRSFFHLMENEKSVNQGVITGPVEKDCCLTPIESNRKNKRP